MFLFWRLLGRFCRFGLWCWGFSLRNFARGGGFLFAGKTMNRSKLDRTFARRSSHRPAVALSTLLLLGQRALRRLAHLRLKEWLDRREVSRRRPVAAPAPRSMTTAALEQTIRTFVDNAEIRGALWNPHSEAEAQVLAQRWADLPRLPPGEVVRRTWSHLQLPLQQPWRKGRIAGKGAQHCQPHDR